MIFKVDLFMHNVVSFTISIVIVVRTDCWGASLRMLRGGNNFCSSSTFCGSRWSSWGCLKPPKTIATTHKRWLGNGGNAVGIHCEKSLIQNTRNLELLWPTQSAETPAEDQQQRQFHFARLSMTTAIACWFHSIYRPRIDRLSNLLGV